MPDLSYLGKMIHDARERAKISSSELCYGLCSISMLSRIESGKRTPDFLLFSALLQRAGGSTSDLVYLCSKREVKLFSIIHDSYLFDTYSIDKKKKILEEYKQTALLSNNLEAQYYYYFSALCEKNADKRYELILKALNCTLPSIDICNDNFYCLSHMERIIITHALHYCISHHKTRLAAKVYETLAYTQEKMSPDTMSVRNSFSDRYGVLICTLVEGDIDEVLHLARKFFKKYSPNLYPDMEITVAKYTYQLGYATLYMNKAASGIDIVTSYYMHRLQNDYKKAEAIRLDALNDLGYEFDIEFFEL